MKNAIWSKGLVIVAIATFFSPTLMPAIGTLNSSTFLDEKSEVEKGVLVLQNCTLPPPLTVDMPLEEAISRRMSIREFTEEPVTDEDLSTVLWAAYGYTNAKRAVHGIEGVYAAEIYVLTEDAVYKYDPLNHSLSLYKIGDYRWIGQYEAPIQLGITWNKSKSGNENYTGAEIGEIGQNIQFMANALDLGTVVTVGMPLSHIGLPPNEVAKIIMPLGHPEHPYKFVYRPMWISLLPRIETSDMNLTTAIKERNEANSWKGELTRKEISQLLWSSYGFSYYLDKSGQEKNSIVRHRTVPSAHGYYPLRIYVVTKSGIYRYIPGLYRYYMWNLPVVNFLMKIRCGDKRDDIANASSQPPIASAPFILISVLDIKKTKGMIGKWDDLSGEEFRWLWYYEAGASAYNVLLEATAWNLSANFVPPTDITAIRSILRLSDNYIPLFIVPVGKEKDI
jgi:nitroreductase